MFTSLMRVYSVFSVQAEVRYHVKRLNGGIGLLSTVKQEKSALKELLRLSDNAIAREEMLRLGCLTLLVVLIHNPLSDDPDFRYQTQIKSREIARQIVIKLLAINDATMNWVSIAAILIQKTIDYDTLVILAADALAPTQLDRTTIAVQHKNGEIFVFWSVINHSLYYFGDGIQKIVTDAEIKQALVPKETYDKLLPFISSASPDNKIIIQNIVQTLHCHYEPDLQFKAILVMSSFHSNGVQKTGCLQLLINIISKPDDYKRDLVEATIETLNILYEGDGTTRHAENIHEQAVLGLIAFIKVDFSSRKYYPEKAREKAIDILYRRYKNVTVMNLMIQENLTSFLEDKNKAGASSLRDYHKEGYLKQDLDKEIDSRKYKQEEERKNKEKESKKQNNVVAVQPNRIQPVNNNRPAVVPLNQNRAINFIARNAVQLGRLLGKGGFGAVYQATWESKTVAVKCYEGERLPEAMMQSIHNEASIMLNLQHEYLIRFFGLVQEEAKPPMLVMEYGAKGSLYEFLHSRQTILWSLRLKIASELAQGLAYLHGKNIVHRDIKSLNIVLDINCHAKWCDFGLAALKLHSTLSSPNGPETSIAGTWAWMAPEQLQRGGISTKSDMWSFGMVCFELASRALPFHDAQNVEQIKDWVRGAKGENVPEECESQQPAFAALMKSCWRERNLRPTASEAVASPAFSLL